MIDTNDIPEDVPPPQAWEGSEPTGPKLVREDEVIRTTEEIIEKLKKKLPPPALPLVGRGTTQLLDARVIRVSAKTYHVLIENIRTGETAILPLGGQKQCFDAVEALLKVFEG